ncbi:hypothetical protein WJX81_002513 [Elliptochloris bilobata]|uniref:Uncharacterized protein n=1 Tax=Elliptochloris bilobata TaxID=381761 RepID=A0AAW1S4Y6_9CHLO
MGKDAHLATWHMAHQTTPAKILISKDVDEVVAAVRDTKTYPTPVIAVGAMHSVTRCFEATLGTVICISAFDGVIGMAGAYDSDWQVMRTRRA